MPKQLIIILFLLASSGKILAGNALEWDSLEREVFPAVGEDKTLQDFWFTNNSKQTVKIAETKTSCGCTTTPMKQIEFKPKERGFIPVLYNFGKSTGLQSKEIVVISNETPPVSYILKLKTHIPELCKIAPPVLFWKVGGSPDSKTSSITLSPTAKAEILEASSTNDNFQVVFQAGKPGGDYKVQVTPRRLDSETRGTIDLTVKLSGTLEKIEKIPVRVEAAQ